MFGPPRPSRTGGHVDPNRRRSASAGGRPSGGLSWRVPGDSVVLSGCLAENRRRMDRGQRGCDTVPPPTTTAAPVAAAPVVSSAAPRGGGGKCRLSSSVLEHHTNALAGRGTTPGAAVAADVRPLYAIDQTAAKQKFFAMMHQRDLDERRAAVAEGQYLPEDIAPRHHEDRDRERADLTQLCGGSMGGSMGGASASVADVAAQLYASLAAARKENLDLRLQLHTSSSHAPGGAAVDEKQQQQRKRSNIVAAAAGFAANLSPSANKPPRGWVGAGGAAGGVGPSSKKQGLSAPRASSGSGSRPLRAPPTTSAGSPRNTEGVLADIERYRCEQLERMLVERSMALEDVSAKLDVDESEIADLRHRRQGEAATISDLRREVSRLKNALRDSDAERVQLRRQLDEQREAGRRLGVVELEARQLQAVLKSRSQEKGDLEQFCECLQDHVGVLEGQCVQWALVADEGRARRVLTVAQAEQRAAIIGLAWREVLRERGAFLEFTQ